MTSERVYTALLRLYPESFRREYCDEMLYAFRRIRRDVRRSALLFWLFVVQDVVWSACQEHVREWTAEEKRLVVRWLIGCAGGGGVSIALIHTLGWAGGTPVPPVPILLRHGEYRAR